MVRDYVDPLPPTDQQTMQEIDHESQDYYILATRLRARMSATRVIKHGETFAVFDTLGHDPGAKGSASSACINDGDGGSCRRSRDTALAPSAARRRPLLLGLDRAQRRRAGARYLANPRSAGLPGAGMLDPRLESTSARRFVLWDGAWYARYSLVHNYAPPAGSSSNLSRSCSGADFADVFESARHEGATHRGTYASRSSSANGG